jgi:transposase
LIAHLRLTIEKMRREIYGPRGERKARLLEQMELELEEVSDVAKAMDYMLKRWAAFTRFLEDGRICLINNAAERELRGIALDRKC